MTSPTISETTTITPPFPIFKGAVYNTNVANNTNIFSTDLTPTYTPTSFLIYYVGNDAGGTRDDGYPAVKRTNGSNVITEKIGVTAFTNDVPAVFQIVVGPNDSINFFEPPAGGPPPGLHISAIIVTEIGISNMSAPMIQEI